MLRLVDLLISMYINDDAPSNSRQVELVFTKQFQ